MALRQAICALGVLAAAAQGTAHGAEVAPRVDPVQRPAMAAPRASQAVMLAVAAAGARWISAGERGIILGSDDGGRSWQQARVPVSVTLTGLSFATAQDGWAVGHGGVVLHTADGGHTWTRQLDGRAAAQLELEAARAANDAQRIALAERLVADGPDKPWLGVHFRDALHGVVVGAYGLIFGTEDGGQHWTSWASRVDNPKGLHLNALHVAGDTVLIVGEQGLMLRSLDGGRSFQRLDSPYHGSWFAVAGQAQQLVIAGLRGHAYVSDDAGQHWQALQVPMPVTIGAALMQPNGQLLLANQAGLLLGAAPGARSAQPLARPPGMPLTALAQSSNGGLMAATFAGAVVLNPPAPASAEAQR